jgi:multiple sugar transport system ATP-binding protein
VNDKAPRDRNLSMVFQNYALYPHLTVYENIAFPLRLAKMDDGEVKKRVTEAADVLELHEHLERKPANLSGGQRQRVAMGRAIVRQAEAFLFDEPLSNLDAKLRGQMRTEISRLQRRLGITTVYVTHDQTEAMTLGDRVAVMRKGILQQVASPRELYEQPVNLFVAGFIGSPPMNFLPATVRATTWRPRSGRSSSTSARPGPWPARTWCSWACARSTSRTPRWSRSPSSGTARPSRPRSTSRSGWATRSTPTSRSTRRRRSPTSCATCPRSWTATSCAPRPSSPSTPPAGSGGPRGGVLAGRRKVHVFDPQTGDNLTRDAEAGARLTQMATEDRVEQVQEAQAQGTTVGGGATRAGAA